jgi:UDP-2,3-diacylglucosamine pyrophosphatase LpxH
MTDKPVTIVISDLHVGGGKNDPGDDHVYQGQQLIRFLQDIHEAHPGRVELIINGDFLDFAQVLQSAFTPTSPAFWCTQQESKDKLEAMIDGHEDIFDALKKFQEKQNQVTIAAGNHDVDLYWPDVQSRLKQVIHADVKFELGETVYFRYGQRLVIGHGHMYDPGNRFKNWKDPIDKNEQRLEMCPGTLFMVKFVNWLEDKYSFADNLKPATALARLLWNEQRADLRAAAKVLFEFTYQNPATALGLNSTNNLKGFARALLLELAVNENFQKEMTELYRLVREPQATTEIVMSYLNSENHMIELLKELMLKLEPQDWLPALAQYGPATLGDDETSLSIIRAGMTNDKEAMKQEAISYLAMESGAYEVVVFGHTHQPDEWRGSNGTWDGGYFNPGSWTRYVDLDKVKNLTLEDLKKEEDFPYQLNFIRIEQLQSGKLRADKICFEEASGARFKPTPVPKKYFRDLSRDRRALGEGSR